MSDERIVEVMAEGMHNANHCPSDGPGTWLPEAPAALAALRDAGFDVYRPEECEEGMLLLVPIAPGVSPSFVVTIEGGSFDDLPLRSRYRLVPISGETPKKRDEVRGRSYVMGENRDGDIRRGDLFVAWSEMEPDIHPPLICAVQGCDRDSRWSVTTERGELEVCDDHYTPEVF